MDMKLEVVVLPVRHVDHAKAFYRSAGFREDIDFASGDDFRVVQFTPPGSEASIVFGKGITSAPPGSVHGLLLVVANIEAGTIDVEKYTDLDRHVFRFRRDGGLFIACCICFGL